MAQPLVSEVGLSEFLHRLIEETFDAIADAALAQERRIVELAVYANLPSAVYASQISDTALQDFLERLFGKHADGSAVIAPSASYTPEAKDRIETPAIHAVLGLQLASPDFNTGSFGSTFTAAGITKIQSQARLMLARIEQQTLQDMIKRGAPRLVPNQGSIRATVSFAVVQESSSTASTPHLSPSPSPSPEPINHGVTMPPVASSAPSSRTASFRVMVRPVDDRKPEVSHTTTGMFGEVAFTWNLSWG